MINFLICLIISILTSCGASILLVEKGKDFPIRRYRIILQKFIHDYIGRRWSIVLKCSTCSSFWISGLVDCLLFIFFGIIFGVPYFFWPFSGFITAGIMWVIIEFLNAMDKNQDINVYIDNNKE